MIKYVITLLAIAFCGFSSQQVFAQATTPDSIQKATPEKLAVMQTNYLKEKLTLTAEQYPKVVELFKKYNLKTDETMKSNMLVSSKVQIIRDTNNDKEAQLIKMLTAEQGKQFQAIRTEFTQKFKQKLKMPN